MICRFGIAPERRFDYVSPAALAVLGYPPEAFYADPDLLVTITHPEDRPAVEAAYDALDAGETPGPTVFRRIRPDGSIVWTETRFTPIADDTGRVVEVEAIVRDVTAAKESEADLAHRAMHDPVTGLPNRYPRLQP